MTRVYEGFSPLQLSYKLMGNQLQSVRFRIAKISLSTPLFL